MRAITIHGYGGPDVLEEQEVAVPACNDNQVLVEVFATSVNPVDSNIRAGRVQEVFPVHSFPHILGLDLAGVVKEVGAAVKYVKQGDRVFGLGSSGTYAEYVVAEEVQLAKLSSNITFNEAGAMPAVALTAWHSLFRYGELKEGERVLIHGGAGGVGHIAIQMAKLTGAHVIATASSNNHEFVRSLGAHEVIDYTAVDFSEAVRDVDMVLDFVVDLEQERNCRVLKKGGRVVSIVTPAIADIARAHGVDGKFVIVDPKREELELIECWMREQQLKVHISGVFSLDEAALRKAHAQIETKHTRGKLLIQIR
ncbi:NADP-dependent oxidoreductase [Paenibacillus sambharensis]|uniref:NADP-dependent oxidoreductase n=1 Tax=Paenibacillus sambharensis TaxID=1803190 RepID=A0A2W1LS86_9BACL|nr:NADP-dependent oxidoreductase [Paenibacillus sambharensis]PZD97635.1 NADP-dependent oxidoreductase [Paenibacillus sambharensis]